MKKIYLQFKTNKRKEEIEKLTQNYKVVKMPLINNFLKIIKENSSIYELILEEMAKEEDYKNIENYFKKNNSVKQIFEEDLEKFKTEEYYEELEKIKREELLEKGRK